MATDSTAICNLSLIRMGQATITAISGTDTVSVKCNLVYPQARDELLCMGPEKGWKFARKTYHGIDVNSYTITAFASASATTTTVTATHALSVGDMVTIDGTTNYDGTYDVVSVSTTVSFVITATFVATETGTAYWTSEEYAYRYARPTCLAVKAAKVAGVELSDWEEEGDWIYTNQEDTEIDVSYVQSFTDTTKFPPHFTKVLVLYVAIQLHYALTQDLKAIDLLERELSFAMPKAIAVDEKGKYVKEYSSSWVDAGRNAEVE